MSQVRTTQQDCSHEEDLEQLCEDLNAYEKELSNIINDERIDFGKHLNSQIELANHKVKQTAAILSPHSQSAKHLPLQQ